MGGTLGCDVVIQWQWPTVLASGVDSRGDTRPEDMIVYGQSWQ